MAIMIEFKSPEPEIREKVRDFTQQIMIMYRSSVGNNGDFLNKDDPREGPGHALRAQHAEGRGLLLAR